MTPRSEPSKIEPPPGENGCVVWHTQQLRTQDQPALAHAASEYATILPAFVFDPSFYGEDGLACDARIRFLHECLADLADQYRERGGALSLFHGDPVEILGAFHDAGWEIVTTADPTGRYGLERDNAVAEACDVTFVDADGLVRGAEDSREDWSSHAEAWFEADQCEWDAEEVAIQAVETPVTIEGIEAEGDVTPKKQNVPTGGTTAARKAVPQQSYRRP